MKLIKIAATLGLALGVLTSCNNSNKKEDKQSDDILRGDLSVLVDESVLPIFLEQKEVFQSSYTNANIDVIAKTEVAAINGLIKGEAPIAFLTRELNEKEKITFEQRSIKPRIYRVAYDGIVLVGNTSGVDTAASISEIKEILEGKSEKAVSLVFEDLNSSIFRQIKDLTKVEKVSAAFVEAKKSSLEVLDEVASNPKKIGLISLNQYQYLESSFTKKDKIRILSVQNDSLHTNKYVKPSQTTLATGEYPLKREILVLNYQPNMGLGIGFSAFMTGDRGQRIVLKSGLLPAVMPGREIIIRDKIN